ncbi:MAG TPA: methyltransferase domain-containing protein [Roseiarcus sp.]
MANPYDQVHYPSFPFVRTHPITTGVFAAIYGRRFPPFAASRVLEVGCGDGVNLINMAFGAPQAEFLGVDLAEQPIAVARAAARRCGCANVSFQAGDLAEIDASHGFFDYIIAHGVYAWVPAGAREALMRVIGERLSDDGLAVVSYNVLPGARFRQAIRDMLLCVTDSAESPERKLDLARSFLAEQIEVWSDAEADEAALKGEARRILAIPPGVLYHDELNKDFAPQLLSETVAAGARSGLTYLCDAQPKLNEEALFPSDALAAIRERAAGDWARFEQLADFRSMPRFRYSLFCRGEADRRLEPTRLRGLWACDQLTVLEADPEAAESAAFKAANGARIKTRDPELAALLVALAQTFPLAVPLDAAAESPNLAKHVFRLFANQVVQVTTGPWPLVAVPSERPKVSALARLQAANGDSMVATLRNHMAQIEDPPTRALLPLMDGTRTRHELTLEMIQGDTISYEVASTRLDEILTTFAQAGLLAE